MIAQGFVSLENSRLARICALEDLRTDRYSCKFRSSTHSGPSRCSCSKSTSLDDASDSSDGNTPASTSDHSGVLASACMGMASDTTDASDSLPSDSTSLLIIIAVDLDACVDMDMTADALAVAPTSLSLFTAGAALGFAAGLGLAFGAAASAVA